MEKYENLGLVGEGSYGMVLRCKHKESGQIVAIKKFLESEDDKMVKKIAMREVRMLKQLRHENLVNLIEVFRRKKRLYLVFEFVDHTVLDDLERCPNGLDEESIRKVLWQVLKGIEFCHLHNIIHRDIKPENILVSKNGVVKLCDFGFARTLAQPGEAYTDYVATRWYRAPELLVGDTKYGREIDIWAVGCLLAEMLTGDPLFPGDSDIDQLFHTVKCLGNLTQRHKEIFHKNPLFVGMRLPEVREVTPLEKKFPRVSQLAMDLMKKCLRLEANDRPTCSNLLKHELFEKDGFAQKFQAELTVRIMKENQNNPLLKSPNISALRNKESPDHENNSKKKKKEHREKKDSEDKPKRKLPDPGKFIKKNTPSTSTVTTTTPATLHLSQSSPSQQQQQSSHHHHHHHQQQQQQQPHHHHQQGDGTEDLGSGSPSQGSMPPIQASTGQPSVTSAQTQGGATINNLSLNPSSLATQHGPSSLSASSTKDHMDFKSQLAWMNEKVKKQPMNFYKKPGPAPNHHSSTLSPKPNLQTEKTSLHDKTFLYDKISGSGGRGSKEAVRDKDRGMLFPELKGAEGFRGRKLHKCKPKSRPQPINIIQKAPSSHRRKAPTPLTDRDSIRFPDRLHNSPRHDKPHFSIRDRSHSHEKAHLDISDMSPLRLRERIPISFRQLSSSNYLNKIRSVSLPDTLSSRKSHPVKNKSKKGYVSSMPHITTLNPFDMQNQDDSSSNFPNV